jgi:N-ethylmaleimide reductase
MSQPDLFSPFQLGELKLPNRIVLAPMTRNRAGAGNVPGALNALYYAQRASAGLLVTEATQVSPQGVGYPNTPGIHSDEQAAGWRLVTDAVHAEGGRIFAQLWHVGRISHPSLQPGGALPVAPSAIAAEGTVFTGTANEAFVTPRALETAEIAGIVQQFAHAARQAKAAGFDGVEVHGANGYLIDQFLRDGTNKRSDAYGGPVENRARFLLEVTDAVAAVWGPARVGVRLSPHADFNSMRDSNPAGTFLHATRALAGRNVGYIHFIEPADTALLKAPRLAPLVRGLHDGALIVNGGYTRESGAAAVAAGTTDLVSFGTIFLANPDLPARFRRDAALNPPDRATFYGGDARGYTDYSSLAEEAQAA